MNGIRITFYPKLSQLRCSVCIKLVAKIGTVPKTNVSRGDSKFVSKRVTNVYFFLSVDKRCTDFKFTPLRGSQLLHYQTPVAISCDFGIVLKNRIDMLLRLL